MTDPCTVEVCAAPSARYLSIARVCDKLSRKKSWTYDRIKNDPTFPRPIHLGKRKAFIESQVDAWVEQQDKHAESAA
jgi:predicted DNA-binding transcriptional regulator AlpA